MEEGREYEYLFKLVIIGDSRVGKSCLLFRFADDSFRESYLTTIRVDFRFKTLDLGETSVKLEIVVGHTRARAISQYLTAYYWDADGCMIVFDKTDRDSFLHTDRWMDELNRHANKSAIKMLVGNKSDRHDDQITREEAEEKAMRYGIPYIETSARSSLFVDVAFETIARELIKQKKAFGTNLVSQPVPKVSLTTEIEM